MSAAVQCPSCGGEVSVTTSAARTASCGYCGSVLIVNQAAIEARGKMALLADSPSCLAVGWRAKCLGRELEVVGRIQYKYHSGLWDEWWVRFLDDGAMMWISQDEGVYTLEKPVSITSGLPSWESAEPGSSHKLGRYKLLVEERDVGEMVGMQGELPLDASPEGKMSYVELANDRIKCTIEYFEDGSVQVFQGRYLKATDLKAEDRAGAGSGPYAAPSLAQPEDLKAGGIIRSADSIGPQSTNCPNCGGSVEIKDSKKAAMIVCQYCGAAMDVSTPGSAKMLYQSAKKKGQFPIPMGSQGTLRGIKYTVIGRVKYKEEIYTWDSLQLFNPTSGYAFLEYDNGHWMFFKGLKHPVNFNPRMARPKMSISYRGQKFKVYETGHAKIADVEGELSWVARIGDLVGYMDAIRPPNMLSAEWTKNEMEWSYGTYMPRADVAKAFGLKAEGLRKPSGIAPAQPFKRTGAQRLQTWIGLAAVIVLLLLAVPAYLFSNAGSEILLNADVPKSYMSEQGWISQPFEVPPGNHVCELHTYAKGLKNEWTAMTIAFLDEEERVVLDADAVMERYSGYSGGEHWSEGSLDDYALFRLEGPATYRLNVFGQSGTWSRRGDQKTNTAHDVQLIVRSDVSVLRYYIIALILVAWYPIWEFTRQGLFEANRWPSEDD